MPYINIEGMKIHYAKAGSGPALVLLHGLGSNADSWKKQLVDLQDQFTVIAWDAPGYGHSADPVPEFRYFADFAHVLKKLTEQLNIEPFYLLGHSMGSTLALEFMKHYSQSVKALILASGTRGGAAKDGDQNEGKLRNRLHAIEHFSSEQIAEQRADNLLGPKATKEMQEEVKRIYAKIRPAGYRSVTYALYHANQNDILPIIDVPTLVICGEWDKITPVPESKTIHQGIRHSKLKIIPDTGHLCYQEDSITFNQHIRSFLANV
jgi:pimeloyl-ACP methyl ester carboxylesterase